jgi:hypothetical protein
MTAKVDKTIFLEKAFDKAIVGHFQRCGKPPVVVYDVDKVIGVLCDSSGMTTEEAEEWFLFNVEGAWLGEGTPAFLYRGKRSKVERLVFS